MTRPTTPPAPAPADAADFSDIDRQMALAFGLLIFSLMLAVLMAGGWYVRGIMEKDQDRLASMTTQVLADAVGRVSFSGKYQVRLFLQQVKKKLPDVSYLRLLDQNGVVVADSDTQRNDSSVTSMERAYIAPLLTGQVPLQARDVQQPNGESIHEISTRYQGGFDNQDLGVIQIGISEAAKQAALGNAALAIFTLLCILLVIGIYVTYRISKFFGLPVRNLAAEMAGERQRLANVLDSMHAGTWEWNAQTDAVTLDERWAEISGHTLADLQPVSGQTFVKLCHPEDLVRSSSSIKAHFSGQEESYSCELRTRHKAGHWIWVRDSGLVVQRDADGAPLKMMGARLDITKRKHAEEALRQESERFVALASVSNTGVWEWDQANGSLWCSPEYFTMLGRDPDDYADAAHRNINDAWLSLLHPEDRERANQSFLDYLSTGSPNMYETEFRMRHANGSWVWIWSRGSTLRDADGKLTAKTLGTHINVTSLKETEARLRESQERLRLISDNIPDSMVFQSDEGGPGIPRKFTYLSDGIHRLHGLAAEDVLRDASLLDKQMHPEDWALLVERKREAIAKMASYKVEVRCMLPDGRQHWFMINASPRKMANGHVVFDGLSIDITERKQHEEEIHELNTRLEHRVQERTTELSTALDGLRRTQKELIQSEKLASLGALVAGMAHELNTPIGNAVTVTSTLMQTHKRFRAQTETGLTRSALATYLDDVDEGALIVERNLTRAAELIGGFKQLAVDQTSYQRRVFALNDVAQEIALSIRPTLRKTTFELLMEIPQDLVLDSFPGPLGQVLINLINNAVLHAFEGRDTGIITLEAHHAGPGWLTVSVTDNGCGIAAEHQQKIFDPFFSTKMGQGGSGLGLHITYTLVTGLLGGRIELRSTPGQGSSFMLHLPVAAPVLAAEGGRQEGPATSRNDAAAPS